MYKRQAGAPILLWLRLRRFSRIRRLSDVLRGLDFSRLGHIRFHGRHAQRLVHSLIELIGEIHLGAFAFRTALSRF